MYIYDPQIPKEEVLSRRVLFSQGVMNSFRKHLLRPRVPSTVQGIIPWQLCQAEDNTHEKGKEKPTRTSGVPGRLQAKVRSGIMSAWAPGQEEEG